jgi:hypothetical protein
MAPEQKELALSKREMERKTWEICNEMVFGKWDDSISGINMGIAWGHI